MDTRLISYRVKAGLADENERLIRGVFAELDKARPGNLGYFAVRAADDAFFHLVMAQRRPSPLMALPAFENFQANISERLLASPEIREVTLVGAYRR